MRDAQLTGIDIHDRDPDDSNTALMFLLSPTRAVPATQELIDEFTLLLKEIETGMTTIATSVEELDPIGDSEEEDFYDTLENHGFENNTV